VLEQFGLFQLLDEFVLYVFNFFTYSSCTSAW